MTPSICDVLPSAAAVLGVDDAEDALGLRARVGDARRLVVILVDGLGLHLLPRALPHAPFLADVLARQAPLELASTFPSTTPTSLVSLGTGVRPGRHGVLGFTLNVPGTDRVLTHIRWGDDPPPAEWQPVPTQFQRMADAGIGVRAVLPAAFVGSGLTDAAYRGARPVAADSEYAARLAAEVAAEPGLVYGYTSLLDTAAHVHGIHSPEWAAAAADVDRLLARVAEALPRDAALVVTADHGGLDVPAEGRIDMAADGRLREGVRVVAGEPRVRYLHTRAGAAGDVRDAWRAILGPEARVLLRDEFVDAGYVGPVSAAHLPRIGDVVVVCRGEIAVLATDREPPEVAALVGMHGADSPAETAIPAITLRR